jgi:hypothetical protein
MTCSAGDAVVEHPTHLGRREVRVEHETRRRAHLRSVTLVVKPLTLIGRSAVLPNDGAAERNARRTVEADRCFSLVGHADRGDHVIGLKGLNGYLAEGCDGKLGDLERVVLDLAWGGEELGELAVGLADGLQLGVKGDRPDTCRTSVESEDEVHPGNATQAERAFSAPRLEIEELSKSL